MKLFFSAMLASFIYVFQIMPAQALIGGVLAGKKQFKSTVFNSECTGSKIGSRALLFAAHCFVDSETHRLTLEHSPGMKMDLKTHYGVQYSLTLENIYIHPTYFEELRRLGRRSKYFIANGAYDIAIVKVKELTPLIPSGRVDFQQAQIGDDVFIGGFGCEGNAVLSSIQNNRYKLARVKVEAEPVIKIIGRSDASKVERFNFFTTGQKMTPTAGSLCPGDSGGPVYRDGEIIGVNSTYLFKDRSGISYVNAHARMSDVKVWFDSVPK